MSHRLFSQRSFSGYTCQSSCIIPVTCTNTFIQSHFLVGFSGTQHSYFHFGLPCLCTKQGHSYYPFWFTAATTCTLISMVPSVDFITGLPPSQGHTTVLTVVDRFSKSVHSHSFQLRNSPLLKRHLSHIFRLHRLPTDKVSSNVFLHKSLYCVFFVRALIALSLCLWILSLFEDEINLTQPLNNNLVSCLMFLYCNQVLLVFGA